MTPRVYHFNNSTVTIYFGNIMDSTAEVIVSSDDTSISMGGGLSRCILNSGGDIIQIDAQKKLPTTIGDVIVSTSGSLIHQKYIFHALTISCKSGIREFCNCDEISTYVLQRSVNKCFRLIHALDINSIAFPCIGNGSAKFALSKVAENMAEAISTNLCNTQKQINVELYLYDRYQEKSEIDYIDIFEQFAMHSALAKLNSIIKPTTTPQYPTSEYNKTSTAKMEHDVFISYSRLDNNYVDSIQEVLAKNNIKYWIDIDGIYSGENWKEAVVDAIDYAKVIIFISSEHSNSSPSVIRELSYAVKQGKTIIPIMVDDTPFAKSIKLDISDIDHITFDSINDDKSKFIPSIAYALNILNDNLNA